MRQKSASLLLLLFILTAVFFLDTQHKAEKNEKETEAFFISDQTNKQMEDFSTFLGDTSDVSRFNKSKSSDSFRSDSL